MDASKHITSAKHISAALLLLVLIMGQMVWDELERRSRILAYEKLELITRVIDSVALTKLPDANSVGGSSAVSSPMRIRLLAHPRELCNISVNWGPVQCQGSDYTLYGIIKVHSCPTQVAQFIVADGTIFIQQETLDELDAILSVSKEDWSRPQCRSVGIPGFLDPVPTSKWYSADRGDTARAIQEGAAKLSNTVYDSKEIDQPLKDMFNRSDVEPSVMGVQLRQRSVSLGIPVVVLALSVSLLHAARRVARADTLGDEPWIILDAEGPIEKIGAALWYIGLILSGLLSIVVCVVFEENLIILALGLALSTSATIIILASIWNYIRSRLSAPAPMSEPATANGSEG